MVVRAVIVCGFRNVASQLADSRWINTTTFSTDSDEINIVSYSELIQPNRIEALNSVNYSLSATLRAPSWIMGPETGIILKRAILNQDQTVTSGSSLIKRVHMCLRLDSVLSSKAIIYSSLRLIV